MLIVYVFCNSCQFGNLFFVLHVLPHRPNARSTRGFVVKAKPQRKSRRRACDCYAFAAITVVLNPSSDVGATKYFVTSSNISSVSVAALCGCSIRLFAICPKQISFDWSM